MDETLGSDTAPFVRVITGHYGSGKTEFAVSLAHQLAAEGRRVALGDLDIVNPYFRSRERAASMEAHGIRVISSSLGHNVTLDLPAISAEIRGPIWDPTYDVILDVGGDAVGANALAEFVNDITRRGYEMWCVVNAYRPGTADLAGVLDHLRSIERTAGMTFTGLISNTHVIRETTTDDVIAGYALTAEVSAETGLPIRYISAIPSALEGLPADIVGERLPIGLHMRDEWM